MTEVLTSGVGAVLLQEKLHPMHMGTSSDLLVGQRVYAIGKLPACGPCIVCAPCMQALWMCSFIKHRLPIVQGNI